MTSKVVRFYLASRKALNRMTGLLDAGFIGFWLGALNRGQLHAVSEFAFERRKKYWTDEHNLQGLWEWEREPLERYFQGRRKLLVPAVGAGREILALRRLGYEAIGFDPHPGLVELANRLLDREGMTADVRVAPWDRCPEDDEMYDGVIIGWGGYMHIRGRSKRIAFLRQLRDRVKVGSPVLLSFFVADTNEGTLKFISRIGGLVAYLMGHEDVEVGDYLAPDYAHYFTRDRLAEELKEGGFDLVFFGTEDYGHAVAVAV